MMFVEFAVTFTVFAVLIFITRAISWRIAASPAAKAFIRAS